MCPKPTWESELENEIMHATAARGEGNEGMARVCARRAAGIIVGEYLCRRGYANLNQSAFDRLSLFISLSGVDDHTRKIAQHFLLKVNPDHNLAVNADLISEANW